jgi:galactose mutarotase-like enzyme
VSAAAPQGWVQISSRELSAAVDPLGAQLSLLRDAAGRDLVWDGDPAFWSGRAPLLFPIVGALAGGRYRLGTKYYSLSRHGFARNCQFEVLEAAASTAAFRLRADESTLALYPFHFELEVRFELQGALLSVSSCVRNPGAAALPASFGFHPALRWPLPYGRPRAEHSILFAMDEPAPVRRLNAQGLLVPQSQPTPVQQRRLLLHDEMFRADALILDQLRSRELRYGAPGGPQLRIAFSNTPFLGVWTKPGAPFICIEPWHGIADPQGFTGDFSSKPGLFLVPPGGTQQLQLQIELLPA